MSFFSNFFSFLKKPFRKVKEKIRLRRKVKTIVKREPIVRAKVWKVEILRTFLQVKSRSKGDYLMPQVRIYRYFRVKPHQRWVNSLRNKADKIFTDKMSKWQGSFIYVSEREKKRAEEIRQVDKDEQKVPFRQTWAFITGEGEVRVQ